MNLNNTPKFSAQGPANQHPERSGHPAEPRRRDDDIDDNDEEEVDDDEANDDDDDDDSENIRRR